MPVVLRAGTDVAELLLFDPAALPQDFDAQLRSNAVETLHRLEERQHLCWIKTGADGGYQLHLYLNEPIPAALSAFVCEPRHFKRLAIPSGELCFVGAEFASRTGVTPNAAYMGEACRIPSGDYQLTLYRTEFPDDRGRSQLLRAVGPVPFYLHQHFGGLIALVAAGLVSAVLLLTVAGLVTYWPYIAAVCLVLIALPFACYFSPPFRRADAAWQAIELEYPSLVACLKRLS